MAAKLHSVIEIPENERISYRDEERSRIHAHEDRRKRGELTPAEYVIKVFGGVRALARALNINPQVVSKWHSLKTPRGREGHIPSHHMRKLLDLSFDQGLDLNPEDLIHGRLVK